MKKTSSLIEDIEPTTVMYSLVVAISKKDELKAIIEEKASNTEMNSVFKLLDSKYFSSTDSLKVYYKVLPTHEYGFIVNKVTDYLKFYDINNYSCAIIFNNRDHNYEYEGNLELTEEITTTLTNHFLAQPAQ